MRRSRWNELLSIANEIKSPNLYQILGVDEHDFDAGAIDRGFRERMQHVQSLRSTKHKEFVEFVKGELRRALRILSHPDEKAAYDEELREDRTAELQRILAPTLAAGVLVGAAEKALLATAILDLGMCETDALAVIETELLRSGAVRVDAPTLGVIPAHEGLTAQAAAELAQVQAQSMARLAEDAAARAREAIRAVGATEPDTLIPLETPSDTVFLPKRKNKKKGKSRVGKRHRKTEPLATPSEEELEALAAAPAPPKVCAQCKSAIFEGWQKTGAAERVGSRLLCSACSAPIRTGKACAGCSRKIAWGEKAVAIGGAKKICATCAGSSGRAKVCAGCEMILTRAAFERGEAIEQGGSVWCLDCLPSSDTHRGISR